MRFSDDGTRVAEERYDVIVAGSGNAAFSAAHSARESGLSVCMLEKADESEIGGNTFFTVASFRTTYDDLQDLLPILSGSAKADLDSIEVPPYTADDFLGDLRRITQGRTDRTLSETLVRESADTIRWLHRLGMRWELQTEHQSFVVDGKRKMWGGGTLATVGGGQGLVDQHRKIAEDSGVELRTSHRVVALTREGAGPVTGVVCETPSGRVVIRGRAVVLACGGFGSNARMRAMHLGPDWDLAKVRGTRHNTGDGLMAGIDVGAQTYGHWSGCHAVQWDAHAPVFGDRVLTNKLQRHSYPYALLVNRDGRRFVDEGYDFRNYTYARMGREVLRQPGGVAAQLFDQRMLTYLRSDYGHEGATRYEADTVRELAEQLDFAAGTLEETVADYNAAVQPGRFDPTMLDGKRTEGLSPPKSNWALPLAEPPFVAYPTVCAITFTYGGLRIDASANVLDQSDRHIPGLYAAGEMVGGLFYDNYPGGSGLMAGSVFGYRAGKSAAAFLG